jgi:antitoxin component YwqK of YwqJK toxin-antitoxin module
MAWKTSTLTVLAGLSLAPAPGEAEPAIPAVALDVETPGLRMVNGVFTYRGDAFSGYVVERSSGRLSSRTPYLKGREDGLAEAFYPDGSIRFQRLYRRGKREGTHRGFWPDGKPQFVNHYEHDLFEGEQLTFFENGAPAGVQHYREGHEEGRQRFYDPTGRVIGNYTFRHGRRYGIVGRFDCVSTGKE